MPAILALRRQRLCHSWRFLDRHFSTLANAILAPCLKIWWTATEKNTWEQPSSSICSCAPLRTHASRQEHTNSANQCARTTHINTLTLTPKSVIHLHKNLNFNLLLVNTRYFCTYLRTRFSWQGQKSMQVCFTQDCVSQSTCRERAMEVKLWGPHHCASTDDSSDGIFRLQKVRRWLILCKLYCFLTPPTSEI